MSSESDPRGISADVHAGYEGELVERGGTKKIRMRQEFEDSPVRLPLLNMPAHRAREAAEEILATLDEEYNPRGDEVIKQITREPEAMSALPIHLSAGDVRRMAQGEPAIYELPHWPVRFKVRMEPIGGLGGNPGDNDPDDSEGGAERVQEESEDANPGVEA